jgi:hypothetical protein
MRIYMEHKFMDHKYLYGMFFLTIACVITIVILKLTTTTKPVDQNNYS